MIYYLILLSIVFLNIKLKKDGGFYLWIGFYLFLLSVIMNLLKIGNLSEFVIRVGLVFLLVGFYLSIREDLAHK